MNDAEQQAALEAALRGDGQARGGLLDSFRRSGSCRGRC